MKEKILEWIQVFMGLRKFTIGLLIIIIAVIFRIKALISGSEFTDLVKAIGVSFFGSNVGENLIGVIKEHLQARREAGNVLVAPADKDDGNQEVEIKLTPESESK